MARKPTPFAIPARLLLAGIVAVWLGAPVLAQQADPAQPDHAAPNLVVPRSPILVVDSERLFSDSRFGAKLREEIEAKAAEIAAENRKLEADLAQEEQDLTEKRSGMTPEDFRVLADAFDDKVTRIRREREQEAAGLGEDNDAIRRQFLTSVEPVLNQIMQESGSAVILERRTVFVTREVVDITDEAIQRIDAALLTAVPADAGTGQGDAADPLEVPGLEPGAAATPDAGEPSSETARPSEN